LVTGVALPLSPLLDPSTPAYAAPEIYQFSPVPDQP